MTKRNILAVILLVVAPAIAVAQSSTATSGTTKPLHSAPTAGGSQNTKEKEKPAIPPAARSGEKGLRVGEGAADIPIEVKRVK
jgi:hypothetical protein